MEKQNAIEALERLQYRIQDLSREELLAIGMAVSEIKNVPKPPRLDWTPCAEGQNLPTKNGAYIVTIEEKKTSERWTTTLRFMDGEWLASDRYRILAWMKPDPYNPDRKEDAK